MYDRANQIVTKGVGMAELTPMMRQYREIKEQHKDCILFYQIGDFYEMFYEDAVICARELEIALTGKYVGQEERAPMSGLPCQNVDSYLCKLIEKGYRVAICDQMEDPKATKGIVKREVIRIVSPGTNLNAPALEEGRNNFLMCLVQAAGVFGIAAVDITTGDFFVTEVKSEGSVINEISKYTPSEIICNQSFLNKREFMMAREQLSITVSNLDAVYFEPDACRNILLRHLFIPTLDSLGLKEGSAGVIAAGAVLLYLYETQKNSLAHLTEITPYTFDNYMVLDSTARRNLELSETLRERHKKGSLLWVLDKTKTAMGARLLRSYMEQPLTETEEINKRLEVIEELNSSVIRRDELRGYLESVYDFERLISRISYKSVGPRDFIAFGTSLAVLPSIKQLISGAGTALLKEIYIELDTLEDICSLIQRAFMEDSPLSPKEGGIIKDGYHEEVDKLRRAKTEGKTWIAELEGKERKKSGIRNLKIKYNRVFGYYLEVTKSNQNLVPDEWIRKQTLSNAERYTTTELKELEEIVVGADDKLLTLEYNLFCQIREGIAREVSRIRQTARAAAQMDVFASLAYVADKNRYVRPDINRAGIIEIKDGRHPVIEQMSPEMEFIPNDICLDKKEKRISILTGPNMAGKSTYMRQCALIVLMAQMGSFIPASSGNISIVDRIFTRIGASDDLAAGQSTFMVEMTEVAEILRYATPNSLIILDEIGRGTSTFDGLGIAWAVVEYIAAQKRMGAKTLFATHYQELTRLEEKVEGVSNYCVAVEEKGEDIIFLRKIIPGGTDKSYGIHVARLAGVPDSVLERAGIIIEKLSQKDGAVRSFSIQKDRKITREAIPGQTEKIIEDLKNLDLNSVTPAEAFLYLTELYQKVNEVKGGSLAAD